ncbi:iron-sulfur cluster assembly 1 homolog, mitochondrial isoform X2 [Chrysemys picta bellii]|uniref:iron-sulfur cluster assembly 1 homolog, mitochondrial isoform X2 n=1 Tax=Chrysemys picta bellii TaxID=8478 RepID=UPI0032B26451
MASSVVRATVRAVSKRKIQATRAALTLTPSAVHKIKQLLKDKPEHVGVKVGVRTRGCNGLSYMLEYTKTKGDSDEEVVQDGSWILTMLQIERGRGTWKQRMRDKKGVWNIGEQSHFWQNFPFLAHVVSGEQLTSENLDLAPVSSKHMALVFKEM